MVGNIVIPNVNTESSGSVSIQTVATNYTGSYYYTESGYTRTTYESLSVIDEPNTIYILSRGSINPQDTRYGGYSFTGANLLSSNKIDGYMYFVIYTTDSNVTFIFSIGATLYTNSRCTFSLIQKVNQ